MRRRALTNGNLAYCGETFINSGPRMSTDLHPSAHDELLNSLDCHGQQADQKPDPVSLLFRC
jgi:hypothetical protein